MGSISVGITQVLTTILGVSLIDRFGRRPLLLISATGTCVCCATIGLSFFLKDLQFSDKFTPALALSGLLVYFFAFGLGMGALPGIISLEVY
ncbi:sugar transporter ERD6-like 5 [Humulus lupulus]|uniref:sugar transporter ERD6-like 5 n=1 Tax=Humulus lupulus TaxID=3486 RepID=UPI002B40073F|nr:sugar transporter ERD6-like 5 [Humulus lupulus]